MKSRTTIWDYVLRGVAIGFLFPIGSIACCVFLFSEITVVHNLQTLHKQFPLLWIIDSAPLVLGTISFIVGNSVTKANKEFAIKIEEANTKLLDNLQIINKFSIIIQNSSTIEDVVWSVAKNAVAQLNYEDCIIYLIDDSEKFLIQRAAHGNKNPSKREILNPIKLKIGQGIVGTVAATGIPEIINDTSKDPRYLVDDSVRYSEITVPIIHDHKVIGVIDSENSEKNFFPNDHLELLTTIAAMTATKLVQTNYNLELQKHQSELEGLVDKRTKELSEKAQKIEDQNIELKKLSLFPEYNPNPVIELDFKYDVVYSNNGAKKHLKDTPLFNQNDPERRKYEALLSKTKKGKKTGVYELKDGFWINKRHYDMNLYIDNEFKILRIYLNDVTEIRRIQNELKQALKKVNIQQTELKDSIQYAKHLQEAILPIPKSNKEDYVESLVLYKPKDIIGGDFFGREDRGENVVFFAADCTGHGVPGALLSFVCFNALNIASSSSPKLNPAEILNKAREVVINTFEKSQETVNDGMDIALCVLNRKTNVLNFAGANSPLFVIKNIDREMQETDVCNESHFIEVTKGDSQPIGNYYNMKSFTNHSFQLSEGDIITVFSDGYPDQFGGKRNKKFGYKRFKNTLLSIHDKPIIEQKKILYNKFMKWKGEYEQIDDVLVLQIRV